jgi:hypothetical protein
MLILLFHNIILSIITLKENFWKFIDISGRPAILSINKPMTLAEIYNLDENGVEEKVEKTIGFR